MRSRTTILLHIAGVVAMVLPGGSAWAHEPLSAETYCRAFVQVAAAETVFLDKVEVLTTKYLLDEQCFKVYCSDPRCYLDQRALYRKEFEDGRAAAYAAVNTTAAEYQAFADANQAAIAAYLAVHPATRASLENLAGQIKKAVERGQVPCHCLLAIASADQKRDQVEKQIAAARAYAGTPEAFLDREQADRRRHDVQIEALFLSFDTSPQEYVFFASKNARAVQRYLAAHPAISRAILSLSEEIRVLLTQYEKVRAGIVPARRSAS